MTCFELCILGILLGHPASDDFDDGTPEMAFALEEYDSTYDDLTYWWPTWEGTHVGAPYWSDLIEERAVPS